MKDIIIFMVGFAIFIAGFGVVGEDEFQPLKHITGSEYAISILGAFIFACIFD